jgi:hypothetical protein
MAGGSNNLNVIAKSPLIANMLLSHYQAKGFEVNGNWYAKVYILVDGVYPLWSCFIQTMYSAMHGELTSMQRKEIVGRALGFCKCNRGL